MIGLNEKGEKLLVKSVEEHTSTIAKIYKVADEFMNSLYIVDNKIQVRRIPRRSGFLVANPNYLTKSLAPYGGFQNFYMEKQ